MSAKPINDRPGSEELESSLTEVEKTLLENIKFGYSSERDTGGIFAGAERSAIVFTKLLAENPRHEELAHIAFDSLASLYADEEMAKYFSTPNFSGYMRLMEKLDDMIVGSIPLDGKEVSPEDNLYTNGTAALAKHMLTVSYIKTYLAHSSAKGIYTAETLKMIFADSLLMQSELQALLYKRKEGSFSTEVSYSEMINAVAGSLSTISHMGSRLFESPNPEHHFVLEDTFATLDVYYADRGDGDKEHKYILTGSKYAPRGAYKGITEGLRTEILSVGYMKPIVDSLNTKLEGAQDIYGSIVGLVRKKLGKGESLKGFSIHHAPADMDKRGIADIVLYAEIEGEKNRSRQSPVLPIEIKLEYMSTGAFMLVSGYYPEQRGSVVVATKILADDYSGENVSGDIDPIKKTTPQVAIDFVASARSPILSLRFPKDSVETESSRGKISRRVLIGGRIQSSPAKDLHSLVYPTEEVAQKKVGIERDTLAYTMLALLKEASKVEKK